MIYDSAIIGGGFFGIRLALLLAKKGQNILLLEQNTDIFQHASFNNQARIHNGYHYPRNYKTALSSHKNYSKFLAEFKDCTFSNFQPLYAIAKNSYTNPIQFEKFCKKLDLPFNKLELKDDQSKLFNLDLISAAYQVEEIVFDAVKLKSRLQAELKIYAQNITVKLNTKVDTLETFTNKVGIESSTEQFSAKKIFNVTYAGINKILTNSSLETIPLKYELTEICLVDSPLNLKNLSVTIMDGPFFSYVPYPSKNCHSLSHVRYTPHYQWFEGELDTRPYDVLLKNNFKSNFLHMQKDAQRYIPALTKLIHNASIFDIKAVLARNEQDDGRPIVLKKHSPDIYSILGTKLDNIYDLEERIEELI